MDHPSDEQFDTVTDEGIESRTEQQEGSIVDEIIKQEKKPDHSRFSWFSSLILVIIFLLGAYFRFTGINWDEGRHQHPDERYLTMVAEKM